MADSNSLKPKPCSIRLFINLWSCSTILFRYLQAHIYILEKLRLLYNLMAGRFALLLSILIIVGLPLFPLACIKNDCSDILCLRLVNKKSNRPLCRSLKAKKNAESHCNKRSSFFQNSPFRTILYFMHSQFQNLPISFMLF